MSCKRTLLINTAANAGAHITTVFISLLALPFMLREFGASVYGVFMIASSLVGLAALFDFGIGATSVKCVAECIEKEDLRRLGNMVSSSVLMYGLIGIGIALVLIIGANYVQFLFRVSFDEAILLKRMLYVHALGQVIAWPCMTAKHILAGYQRYGRVARISIGSSVLGAGAIVLVLIMGEGPLTLTILNVVILMLAALAGVIAAWRVLPRGFRLIIPPREANKAMLAAGFPLFTIQISAFFMRQQIDRLVIGVFIGAAGVALYEIAAKLGTLVSQLNDLTVSALLPFASRLSAAGDYSGLQATFLLGSRYIALLVMPIISMLFVWAPAVIGVWCGAEYAQSIASARLLIGSQTMLATYIAADSILISFNRFGRWAPYAVALALLNLGLSILLVQSWGITGAAVGTFVACLCEAPLYLRVVLEEMDLPYKDWMQITLIPAFLALISSAVLSVGISAIINAGSAVAVLSGSLIAVLTSYLFVYWLLLRSHEKLKIRTTVVDFVRELFPRVNV